jgi:hypothetical protein
MGSSHDKHNITLAISAGLLKRARAVAAKRGTSVSAMLAEELSQLVADDARYDKARKTALALLDRGFHLGNCRARTRDELHDRAGLR